MVQQFGAGGINRLSIDREYHAQVIFDSVNKGMSKTRVNKSPIDQPTKRAEKLTGGLPRHVYLLTPHCIEECFYTAHDLYAHIMQMQASAHTKGVLFSEIELVKATNE